ncbi:MAG: glycosyltransferase family 4 protein [Planctomycetota bacterium]
MKVLYLSITSEIGGADLAMLRTVRELDRSRFQPVVALPGEGPLVEAFRDAGAETVFFPMRRLRRTLNPLWHLGYCLAFRGTCRRIADFAREAGAALVHTNSLPNIYGASVARMAGVPHVWEVREIDLRPRMVRRWLVRRALRGADRIVAMSETIVAELFPGRPQNVTVVYGAVDLRKYRPDLDAGRALRERFGLEPEARLAGIWCRFDEWKGIPIAVRAAGKLAGDFPGFKLLVAGGPTAGHEKYAEELRRLAESESPGSVLFTGWLEPESIPQFVAGLDVAVHASTSPEPFGLVIAEAMAAGAPLVAPRVGSPLELVEDGTDGLLYPAGDPDGLAAAAGRLLGDRDLAGACAAAGRAKAERLFDVSLNVRKLEGIYEQLAGEGGS